MATHTINYTPPPTISEFIAHYEPGQLFADWIIGPVGCLPADSEFLTPAGWKRMDAYAPGDRVAEWLDGEITFKEAQHVALPALEEFYAFDSGSLEMVLSPEHTVIYQDYLGRQRTCTAAEMAAHPSRRTIPTTFRTAATATEVALSDEQIRLRVAVSADGHFPNAGQQCVTTLRKDRKKRRLQQLLDAAGVEYKVAVSPARPTETRYTFSRLGLTKDLSWVWGLSSRQLAIVLDECTRWDGLNEHAEKRYYTTIPAHADAIQYAAHACGYRASISAHDDPRSAQWATNLTVSIRTSDNHKNRAAVREGTRISRVPAADGMKYCFHTTSGFFVARHNGSVFVTGNSGKTTGIFFKLAYMATLQAPSPIDGIRRSRAVVVRNTMPQLKDTTLMSWSYWFKDGQAGEWKSTDKNFTLKFGDVECEVLFRPLDTPDDVERVLSLEVTFAVIDEFVQIDKAIIEALLARCGRYPPPLDGGATNWGMWGSSNPGNEDSWWHDMLETDKLPANWTYFKQPSGLSPYAENVDNLPGGRAYYSSLVEGKSEHWVKQFIETEWGYSLEGTPVMKQFNRAYHVSEKPLLFNPHLPLVAGYDPGLGGSGLIFGQMDLNGRLFVLSELVQEGISTDRICRERLAPHLRLRYAEAREFIISPDPAAAGRSNSDERSSVDVLRKNKYVVKFPDMNNFLETRMNAIDHFASRITQMGPALQIDPGCKTLIRALQTGWRYKVKKDGNTNDEPEKNKYSHPADAFGYLCKWFANTDPRYSMDNAKRKFIPPRQTSSYHVR